MIWCVKCWFLFNAADWPCIPSLPPYWLRWKLSLTSLCFINALPHINVDMKLKSVSTRCVMRSRFIFGLPLSFSNITDTTSSYLCKIYILDTQISKIELHILDIAFQCEMWRPKGDADRFSGVLLYNCWNFSFVMTSLFGIIGDFLFLLISTKKSFIACGKDWLFLMILFNTSRMLSSLTCLKLKVCAQFSVSLIGVGRACEICMLFHSKSCFSILSSLDIYLNFIWFG